jgi:multidrug efflux pump subunit AcrB
MKNEKFKEFFATSWAINNKTSVYIIAIFITILGMMSYISIPKEQFPEIVIPTIMVSTPYPGTSPEDMKNLVTQPIEKQLKSLGGVKKITSNSIQDFSMIVVEFNTDVAVADAKQKVRDAVDKAKPDLPTNLPRTPDIMEIDFSEIPIMYIQISGDYDLNKLKVYAEHMQDQIEGLPEITRVDLVGTLEREIQINVDMYKMQAASITLSDIERAVSAENMTISAGTINTYGMNRTLRIVGQFYDMETIGNIAMKSSAGGTIYLKEIAQVKDTVKEQESFSRLNGKNVVTLNVIKKSGQNLIDAADQIKEIIAKDQKEYLPKDVNVAISGDMSRFTRNTLDELNNTIIIGFILVILVLMFFMGFTNAFFVGLSVPLSMFVAYLVMPGLGFTMNMIVMFGFIFALGIIVDDAIVVIENTHRIHKKVPDIVTAAKMAAGEVFLPILSGTLTTLAPFFPLAFWPGVIGTFMHYMPVTLILTLFASLFVAYIINPVFAVSFMKHEYDDQIKKPRGKFLLITGAILVGLAGLFYIVSWPGVANFLIFVYLLIIFYQFVLKKLIAAFQEKFWPRILRYYERILRGVIRRKRAYTLLWIVVGLFIATLVLFSVVKPKVLFFPDNQPNNIAVLITMPTGTNQTYTDSICKVVEKRVYEAIGDNNPDVESVVTNVTAGAGEGSTFDRTAATNKAKITVNFVEYKNRIGPSTMTYLDKIRSTVKGIAGAEIVVQKNRMGPPTGKPINVEISGDNIDDVIATSVSFKRYLDSLQIPGVEELKSDFITEKPELIIVIDRERANREGLSTAQIGMEIRTAVFGKEISKYKDGDDEYEINLRYQKDQRENIDKLLNLKITYRDMTSGQLRQIPLSSVAHVEARNSFGGINRKDLNNVINLYSEVLSGYTANDITNRIGQEAKTFSKPEGVTISMTGERTDMKDATSFLGKAMLIAIGLIFFILMTQFNSISKTLIILSEVFFSIIGVLLGIMIFGMSLSVIMTGLGIVALGGIVVRNGILIVEFTDVLKKQGLRTREAVVQAGLTRITPVVLTATATILGLIPLAVGLNINFVSMFTELNPHLHFGGDNVAFWGNLSWTIIFGLSFATFLTLIFVPAMYLASYAMKVKLKRRSLHRKIRKAQLV